VLASIYSGMPDVPPNQSTAVLIIVMMYVTTTSLLWHLKAE